MTDQPKGWILGPTEGRTGMPWCPDSASMKEKWLSYYKHMYDLSEILMSLFALSLDLESDYFVNSLKGGNSSLRSVYYPNVRMDHDETVEHKVILSTSFYTLEKFCGFEIVP
eukprot:TRINITY_DN2864_c0_g1_i15.p1 TRINITY_DN2864_c0_g1~~TRINITY_DN2864_c0_g1_i15.p1  ORF type:complete len:112 (-),score=14.13 TRINITY_DN2864_c0_g1_i15:22-357(-)